jgi:hypothetical protein
MFETLPHIIEPSRDIPIIEKVDVLVVGGGPAGIAAALAAQRRGLHTVLIERNNHLGGLWTGGLILILLSTHAVDQQGNQKKVVFGIGDEIAQRLRSMGMAIEDINPIIDPEAAKYVFDVMMKEAGVKVLYQCWASNIVKKGDKIDAVIFESKSGRVAIRADVVVDATGDGDIFAMAGESFINMPYHIGLAHRLGNIDRVDHAAPGFKKVGLGKPTPNTSVNWINMLGQKNSDGLDLFTLSELNQAHRIRIWEDFKKLKAIPGYEKIFILDTASQLGVRVSRVLAGQYQLTLEDSMTFHQFADVVGICGAWRDITYHGQIVKKSERPIWQIPLRSILPKKTGNLVVAGRCFSFEAGLVEDARIIGTALLTGHAAGAAAAVAAKKKVRVQEISYQAVQRILLDQNAYLG